MGGKRSIPTVEHLLEDAQQQHLLDSVNKDSALACALVVSASIEKAVLALVGKYFVDCSETQGLLNGPLGKSASRATVAHCLGLISEGMLQNILKIGRIRNIFAHSNTDIDFDDSEVVDLCNSLTFPQLTQSIVAGKGKPTPKKARDIPPRERFSVIGISVSHLVLSKANSIKHKDQFTDEWDSQ